MTASETPVIVLGVDTPIGLAILRDLGRHGYFAIAIGASRRSIGLSSRYCSRQVIRPRDTGALISTLCNLGAEYPGAALLSISEQDNLLINRHRAELGRCLKILVPEQSLLDKVHDKSRCIQLASEVGIRVPQTFTSQSLQEIERIKGELPYPLVAKWADPNLVIKDLVANKLPVLKCEYILSETDLLDKMQRYSAIGRFPLLQEYCPGKGIGQMFLFRNGRCILEFQHARINEMPPEGGISTYCKSVALEEHKACRKRSIALLEKLNWDGVAMVEYRFNETTGEYFFMEVNGRFWGSLPLAIAAGVPFAAELVKSASPDYQYTTQKPYKKIYCRFMLPELRRLFVLLFKPESIQDPTFLYRRVNELLKFLAAFFRPDTCYFVFDKTDRGPFFTDMKNLLRKLGRARATRRQSA